MPSVAEAIAALKADSLKVRPLDALHSSGRVINAGVQIGRAYRLGDKATQAMNIDTRLPTEHSSI
jgi:hypothetical protein